MDCSLKPVSVSSGSQSSCTEKGFVAYEISSTVCILSFKQPQALFVQKNWTAVVNC